MKNWKPFQVGYVIGHGMRLDMTHVHFHARAVVGRQRDTKVREAGERGTGGFDPPVPHHMDEVHGCTDQWLMSISTICIFSFKLASNFL